MSVRAGREFLAIPGPTTVPDEVLRAMHRPAVDISSGPLLALTDGLLRDIARVFNTKGRAYIYISNGHGAWEASLTNVLSKGSANGNVVRRQCRAMTVAQNGDVRPGCVDKLENVPLSIGLVSCAG